MARYSAGASRAGVNTADQAYFQLRPIAATDRIYIKQLVVAVAVAPTTAPLFYLARSTAIGTVTTTLAGQPRDPNVPAGVGTFDSVFSVQPTFVAATKLDIGALAVTAGGVFVWSFWDEPLVINANVAQGIVIANANAAGATLGTFAASAVWED